jgi:hypothetical protein
MKSEDLQAFILDFILKHINLAITVNDALSWLGIAESKRICRGDHRIFNVPGKTQKSAV